MVRGVTWAESVIGVKEQMGYKLSRWLEQSMWLRLWVEQVVYVDGGVSWATQLGRKRQWGSSSVSGWLISLAEIANWVNRANLEGRSVSG